MVHLSDPQAEDAIYDSEAMRFARVELGDDVVPDDVPDETTIPALPQLLDATIMAAPNSTKNAGQARDPEMKQTREGNTWYSGMKLHLGTALSSRE